ncbi:Spo0E family sporulation regulatory protein-aspartic acid phosphatase [Paenibacillus albiflavus]|uniref:Spo0E family sporulation regulatory protein-aspartic acid phosphatase n=1 Tax=Paenibacillus albiflavus TaxID=2545760 RepID=A0A4R4E7R8_9BACL|nr:Spo0E family sporulation regulatory protein-aspartic acid phosphatase [Paenibacillus albiflavus]TCZ73775.1 Spo0E family sporulation regulatory protein-aspartic acid phosphatase [Paenibacillus albiflavus]
MTYIDYQLLETSNQWLIQDSTNKRRWLLRKSMCITSQRDLEEQIHDLRLRLERLVLGGQKMTSDRVIEVSMELDVKIIEYMNTEKGTE